MPKNVLRPQKGGNIVSREEPVGGVSQFNRSCSQVRNSLFVFFLVNNGEENFTIDSKSSNSIRRYHLTTSYNNS